MRLAAMAAGAGLGFVASQLLAAARHETALSWPLAAAAVGALALAALAALEPSPEATAETPAQMAVIEAAIASLVDAEADYAGVQAVISATEEEPWLPLARDPRVLEAARAALRHYGCGACGPRGFFGTSDVHVRLERMLAQRYGQHASDNDAIIYASSYLAALSVVRPLGAQVDAASLLAVVGPRGLAADLLDGAALARLPVQATGAQELGIMDGFADETAAAELVGLVLVDVAALDGIEEATLWLWRQGQLFVLDERQTLFRRGPLPVPANVRAVRLGSFQALGVQGAFVVGPRQLIECQRLGGAGYTFSAALPAWQMARAEAVLRLLDEATDALVPEAVKADVEPAAE